jgi:hypothetical protein
MSQTTSYNCVIFQLVRGQDPELAEDLNRRMTLPLITTFHMSTFFNDILQQYPQDWVKPWIVHPLNIEITEEEWFTNFRDKLLPFLAANRLPPAAHGSRAIYPL